MHVFANNYTDEGTHAQILCPTREFNLFGEGWWKINTVAALYTTAAAFQVSIARAMAGNAGDISETGVREPEETS